MLKVDESAVFNRRSLLRRLCEDMVIRIHGNMTGHLDMFVGLLVAVFIAVCECSMLRPCCLPRQWSGKFKELVGTSVTGKDGTNVENMISTINNITYDYTRRRVALQELVIGAEFARKYHVIGDYREKKGFLIDAEKSLCVVFRLPSSMQSPCIPRNSTYLGRITYGLGAKSLAVDTWRISLKNRFMTVGATMTVNQNCIPVHETAAGVVMTTKFMTSISFYDITMGVKDRSVFRIPPYCKNKDVIREEKSNKVRYVLDKLSR